MKAICYRHSLVSMVAALGGGTKHDFDTAEAEFWKITWSARRSAGFKSVSRHEPRQPIFETSISHPSHGDTAFIDDSVGGFHQGQDEDPCVGRATAPHDRTMGTRHPVLPQHQLVCIAVATEKRLLGRVVVTSAVV